MRCTSSRGCAHPEVITYIARLQRETFGEIWGALGVHMACNPQIESRLTAEHFLNTRRTSSPDRMGPWISTPSLQNTILFTSWPAAHVLRNMIVHVPLIISVSLYITSNPSDPQHDPINADVRASTIHISIACRKRVGSRKLEL